MRFKLIILLVWVGMSILLSVQPILAQPKIIDQSRKVNFDNDWKFHLGDLSGAENPDYSDALWRTLDLPHDWSIEGSFRPDNPSGHQGGLLPGGIGWHL